MKKSIVILTALNVVAMLCMLAFVASAHDLALVEERDSYDFGDSAGFLLFVAPLLLLCMIANLGWAGTALWTAFKRRSYQSALAFALVLTLWAIAIPVSREWARLPAHVTQ